MIFLLRLQERFVIDHSWELAHPRCNNLNYAQVTSTISEQWNRSKQWSQNKRIRTQMNASSYNEVNPTSFPESQHDSTKLKRWAKGKYTINKRDDWDPPFLLSKQLTVYTWNKHPKERHFWISVGEITIPVATTATQISDWSRNSMCQPNFLFKYSKNNNNNNDCTRQKKPYIQFGSGTDYMTNYSKYRPGTI